MEVESLQRSATEAILERQLIQLNDTPDPLNERKRHTTNFETAVDAQYDIQRSGQVRRSRRLVLRSLQRRDLVCGHDVHCPAVFGPEKSNQHLIERSGVGAREERGEKGVQERESLKEALSFTPDKE